MLLGGCLPIPERIYETPAVEGRLLRGGTPQPGAVVVLADLDAGASCAAPSTRTRTDTAGRFSFAARYRTSPFTLLLGVHQSQEWLLCTDAQGERAELARVSDYVMGGGAAAVRLTCELDRLADGTAIPPGYSGWNDPARDHAPCVYTGDAPGRRAP